MLSEREKLGFFVSPPWMFCPEPEVLVWEEGKNLEAATSPIANVLLLQEEERYWAVPSRQEGSNDKTQL